MERSFTGRLLTDSNFKAMRKKYSKKELNFQKKALKAYLKGDKTFRFGFSFQTEGNIQVRKPEYYQTPQHKNEKE